jgi:type IV secretory pathway TraG/TraD family ATPase VirD4
LSDFWEFQKLSFRVAGGVAKMAGKAITGSIRAGQYGADAAANSRMRRQSAQGVLGPGDPPAPPGVGVLDYRGLAPTHTLQLPEHGLPLGRVIDVHRGPVFPCALPVDAIFRHACVIGPPGSGKTYSIIAPWIVALLHAGFSVATIDVKGDLFDEIQACAATYGSKTGASGLIWDYAAPRTHRWNFLHEVTSDRGVEAIVLSLLGRPKENDSQPYFYQRDYRWLKGLARLTLEVRGAAAQPRHLLELLADQGMITSLAPNSSAHAELFDLAALDPADYGRDISGIMNVLSIFGEPEVNAAVAVSDFQLEQVLSEPTLLIGVARLSDGRRAEQMSSLLLSQLSLTVLERFGRGTPRPFAFVIDEAPRLKDRIDLEALVSVARGARVGVCLSAQDVSQFGTADRQNALLASCHTYVSMSGVSPTSAEYLSRRLGTRQREQYSYTQPGKRGIFEPPARSYAVSTGPTLESTEIMYLPFGQHAAIVHNPAAASGPFIVELSR